MNGFGKSEGEARVPDGQIEYGDDLVYLVNGERFTGIGYEDIPSYGLSEISYRDGMQDGPARDWLPSGQLKVENFYKRNFLHGTSREFRPDGSLISEKIYEYGILLREVTFDEVGNVIGSSELSEDSPNFLILQRLRTRYRD